MPPNPPRLCRTDMGGRPGLFWDLAVPRGPCRTDLLPPLPLWTQWPFLRPRPHWLEGPALQCRLCAGQAVLAGWGIGSISHRAFVSSQRDRLPQLTLELPPAGSCCIPEPQPSLRLLPQHSQPHPHSSQKPQGKTRCDLPPSCAPQTCLWVLIKNGFFDKRCSTRCLGTWEYSVSSTCLNTLSIGFGSQGPPQGPQ